MNELSDKNLEIKIIEIVENGNEFHVQKDYDRALKAYLNAWELIPEPKLEWEVSNWISSCIYSAYFDIGNYITAKEWGEIELITKPSDIDTAPYINLGMVNYELEQYDISYNYFEHAYNIGKKRAFNERPKKYLDFYLSYKK
ncbi:hypothetical protein OSB94_20370 [Proteus vulgaris]|uniref:hypothetical protein n=1 Tax=Proteus vulgaris TaxID=585 RepID=UPI001B37E6AE|nr:hypothetical protein [Proteus vulgaris]MBQ0215619.1 hypothetical protein [Proteus vulgaris]MDS0790446.1 hypothetical protein [Proteus vulgaris]